jgi:hypothetical protein
MPKNPQSTPADKPADQFKRVGKFFINSVAPIAGGAAGQAAKTIYKDYRRKTLAKRVTSK